jgi:predicted metal-binding protein
MALSTESCDICESCTFPQGLPCRFPEKMHPCVESHGIIVSELAEKYDMEFTLSANQILWFGILFIN